MNEVPRRHLVGHPDRHWEGEDSAGAGVRVQVRHGCVQAVCAFPYSCTGRVGRRMTTDPGPYPYGYWTERQAISI